ncbi:unnamed protein product, partial [Notodromas monacha]
ASEEEAIMIEASYDFAQHLSDLKRMPNDKLQSNIFWSLALESFQELEPYLQRSADEMLQTCEFSGKPCDPSQIGTHVSVNYGHCVTYNSYPAANDTTYKPSIATSDGIDGGLKIRLKIDEDEYVRVPSQVTTAGLKVGIFPVGSPPNVEEEGIDVVPGQSTHVRLKSVLLKRLPDPYPSGCQNGWDGTLYTYGHFRYDYRSCRRFCTGHNIFLNCECIDPQSNAQD